MTIYSILEILGWVVHGWWQRLIVEAGLPSWLLFTEPADAPQMWLDIFPEWQWDHELTNGKPGWYWCFHYTGCVRVHFENWVLDKANRARDTAVSWVRAFTGYLSFGYTTFQAWLTALRGRVGTWVPSWAHNLADAAHVLYHLLPRAIRYRWQTWGALFDDIKATVRSWVEVNYNLAKERAYAVYHWLNFTGQRIERWWRDTRAWADDFRRNPYGYVAGLLGDDWRRLVAFGRLALDFYSRIWSYHAQELADFLADPGGFLWGKLEAEIGRRW